MVSSFSTAENKYSFEIDGKPYVLPLLSYGEFEDLPEDKPRDEIASDLLAAKADKRTLAAIRSLSVSQVAHLIKDWMGADPGESSASADS